ncbi:hypothetical protein F4212_05520 [Candidatus Poribacteria bacterium]|nr:hypothetical protein [Candidatus Poribacteria bacterium]
MDNNNFVRDKEELYRSVRGEIKYDEYSINDAPAVFRDRQRQPSVDRAELRGFDPLLSKLGTTDGIVSLITGEVRCLPKEDIELTDHTIDVIYMPTTENIAHSQIMMNPTGSISKTRKKKAFKSLQKVLARLANLKGWTLKPITN